MIRQETIGNSIRTWSDRGTKIHGGFPEADYDEAYDPADAGRTYTETNIPIDGETNAEELLAMIEEIL